MSGDVETWIANQRFTKQGAVERELIGTDGDRIALERVLWTGEGDASGVEREHLRLTEVDAEGRIRASIRFDLDDRRAAFAEAQLRFAAGEGAGVAGYAVSAAFTRAYGTKDWSTLRSLLAEDAVFSDHRAFGFGAFPGEFARDAWIDSVVAFRELAPDFDVEPFRALAWSPHGSVGMARIRGTLRDGGPFEHVLIALHATDGERITRFEAFDVGDVERALARFAELCSDRVQPMP